MLPKSKFSTASETIVSNVHTHAYGQQTVASQNLKFVTHFQIAEISVWGCPAELDRAQRFPRFQNHTLQTHKPKGRGMN